MRGKAGGGQGRGLQWAFQAGGWAAPSRSNTEVKGRRACDVHALCACLLPVQRNSWSKGWRSQLCTSLHCVCRWNSRARATYSSCTCTSSRPGPSQRCRCGTGCTSTRLPVHMGCISRVCTKARGAQAVCLHVVRCFRRAHGGGTGKGWMAFWLALAHPTRILHPAQHACPRRRTHTRARIHTRAHTHARSV